MHLHFFNNILMFLFLYMYLLVIVLREEKVIFTEYMTKCEIKIMIMKVKY